MSNGLQGMSDSQVTCAEFLGARAQRAGARMFLLLLAIALPCSLRAESDWNLNVETGLVHAGRADVRIPNESGTRFSLTNDLRARDDDYTRVRLSRRVGDRHIIALTIAPLDVSATGRLPRDTRFVDTVFPADTNARAGYRFNNDRLTYRYILRDSPRWRVQIGGTAFVRDAEITLQSGSLRDKDDDLGFVPLASFRVDWRMTSSFSILLDGDALAAPQGRAEDVLVALLFNVSDKVQVKAGYRLVEGGADNDEVYNFTLINYASAGAIISF